MGPISDLPGCILKCDQKIAPIENKLYFRHLHEKLQCVHLIMVPLQNEYISYRLKNWFQPLKFLGKQVLVETNKWSKFQCRRLSQKVRFIG